MLVVDANGAGLIELPRLGRAHRRCPLLVNIFCFKVAAWFEAGTFFILFTQININFFSTFLNIFTLAFDIFRAKITKDRN